MGCCLYVWYRLNMCITECMGFVHKNIPAWGALYISYAYFHLYCVYMLKLSVIYLQRILIYIRRCTCIWVHAYVLKYFKFTHVCAYVPNNAHMCMPSRSFFCVCARARVYVHQFYNLHVFTCNCQCLSKLSVY